MQPPAEHVHWLFATGFLLLSLCLLARAIVGAEVWARRAWRAYLWPSLLFGLGVLMWPVMVFFTNSTIHMVAHGAWAQTMMLAGAAELGLAKGKLSNPPWGLAPPLAFRGSGGAGRRRGRAGAPEGQAVEPALASRHAVRVPRLGGRGAPARAEPVVLPTLGVPS